MRRSLLSAAATVLGMLALSVPASASAAPLVGIQYETWFDLGTAGGSCSGSGWAQNPFGLKEVEALDFPASPSGYCYSSDEPSTARTHAASLDELGVDFVEIDDTNYSKTMKPSENPIFQAAKKAIEGFKEYTHKKIQVTFQLSLTCYAETCDGIPGDQEEIFTYNEYVREEIEEIYKLYLEEPSRYVTIEGKPLILFYVNKGSNVHNLDGSQAFSGPGDLIPTSTQFNPPITTEGTTKALRELFSVRYAIVAESNFDYRPYSSEIWPFACFSTSCQFSEVGYATLYSPGWSERSLPEFDRQVNEASGLPYIMVANWNEFSSTDEHGAASRTIEPNTQLYKVDSTPGHADPWYFFNGVKSELQSLRDYQVTAFSSSKCMDVTLESVESGARIQQYECRTPYAANQIWHLVPTGFPYYEIVNEKSGKCLDVIGESTSAGAGIQQYTCLGITQTNQLWEPVYKSGEAFYELRNKKSGMCLDVTGNSMLNGAQLQQYNCTGAGNQLWWLHKVN
ncbi:MAG: RICIN domain-containing protein [Solirubrobacterales bacterium]